MIPWPKLLYNLRSSRRTELQELFPDHVVNKWLGHSGQVAERHYLQVTDEHWSRAVESRSPTGSPITADQDALSSHHPSRETHESDGLDGSRELLMAGGVTP